MKNNKELMSIILCLFMFGVCAQTGWGWAAFAFILIALAITVWACAGWLFEKFGDER